MSKIRSHMFTAINSIAHTVETRKCKRVPELPILFIIGAPRSGTTLLFQVLTDAFDLGYVSNSHARLYGGISYWEKWIRPLKNRGPSDFQSSHGRTNGPTDPSECGAYWNQFFRSRPLYTPIDEFPEKQAQKLEASLTRIYKSFGSPVVFKNVMNSARIQVLSNRFPNAIFLVSQRDVAENALSIMTAKQKISESSNQWWSLAPEGYEEYQNARAEVQAVQQVILSYRMIRKDLAAHDSDKVCWINYEDLCNDPRVVLENLYDFLRLNFPQMRRIPEACIPNEFQRRKSDPSLGEFAAVKELVENLNAN